MKQVPFGAVKHAKVHVQAQLRALCSDGGQGLFLLCCRVSFTRQCVAGPGYRQQVASEVAAIHGRYIGRLQHLQRLGLVPIEQMPFVFGQAFYRLQRQLQALHQLGCSDPAELARAGCRQQIQADVGRRCAVRQRGLQVYLQIVWRQVVVLRADTILKVAPGIARQRQQVSLVVPTQAAGSA